MPVCLSYPEGIVMRYQTMNEFQEGTFGESTLPRRGSLDATAMILVGKIGKRFSVPANKLYSSRIG